MEGVVGDRWEKRDPQKQERRVVDSRGTEKTELGRVVGVET